MQFLDRIDRAIKEGLKWCLIILMFAVTVSVSWGVFTRYVLNAASTWTFEFSGFCLAWISLLGSANLIYKKNHIRFESLFDALPKSARLAVQTLLNLFMIIFVAVIMVLGYKLAINAMEDATVSLPISKGVVYLILPISGALMLLGLISDTVHAFVGGDAE